MIKLSKNLIEIDSITKKYENFKAVDNFSLKIPQSSFAILGPNGAGKTTIILMLMGYVKPNTGSASIFGYDSQKDTVKIKSRIGFLPEEIGFYSHLNGFDHLKFILELKGKKEKNIEDLLRWCGLSESFWHKKIYKYSHGMRKRLGLAIAFAGEPDLVILDEPLSGIDPIGREDIIQKIRLKVEEGVSILYSSHIISEVEQFTDNFAIINKGKLIMSGLAVDLALKMGFIDFEIESDLLNIEQGMEILNSEDSLIIGEPFRVDNKILIKSKNPTYISEIFDKSKVKIRIKPIPGTLLKIYKKILSDK